MRTKAEIVEMQEKLRSKLIDRSDDELVTRIAYVMETALEWVLRTPKQDKIDLVEDAQFSADVIRRRKEYLPPMIPRSNK